MPAAPAPTLDQASLADLKKRVELQRAERRRLMDDEDSFNFWDHLVRERPY